MDPRCSIFPSGQRKERLTGTGLDWKRPERRGQWIPWQWPWSGSASKLPRGTWSTASWIHRGLVQWQCWGCFRCASRMTWVSMSDELARTIQSHLWLANLDISSGCTPTWSATLPIPREPQPDGPTITTWNQLEDVHKAIVTAHRERDVSGMLKLGRLPFPTLQAPLRPLAETPQFSTSQSSAQDCKPDRLLCCPLRR